MVSVCMAAYNGERFVKEQIDSILPQLSENDELIISDDGSTDNTLAIIKSYNDSRIKIFYHEKNPAYEKIKHGRNFYYATSNFENALKQAQGDYIFLSDQDDIWLPGKVTRCMELLQRYDCVVHNYQKIDSTGKIFEEKAFKKSPLHKSVWLNIADNHFRGCCMAFSRKILEYSLPFPKKLIGHDYWIGIVSSHLGSFYYEKQPLIQSRWYEDSVSAVKKTSFLYKISFRIDLLKAHIQFARTLHSLTV